MFFSAQRLLMRLLLAAQIFALCSNVYSIEQTKIVLKHNFNRSTEGWITPKHWGWNGKTERTADGTMRLTATQKSAKQSFSGRSYTVSNAENVRGLKLELSCKVRGKGKVRLGAMYRVLAPGKSRWHYTDYIELTDQ